MPTTESETEQAAAPATRPPTPVRVRTLLGAALIVLLVLLLAADTLWPQGFVFVAIGAVLLTVATREFVRLVRALGAQVDRSMLLVGGAAVFVLQWAGWASPGQFPGPWLAAIAVLCVVFAGLAAGRICAGRIKGTMEVLGTAMVGIVYLPVMFGFLTAIRLRPGESGAPLWGLAGVIATVAVCKSGSIGAYFVGKSLGRHKLTPVVSPNKTVEGAVGALVLPCAVSVGLSYSPWSLMSPAWAVLFGLAVAIAGMMGDLTASILKREAAVKDSGNLLPGFGGMLDMLDDVLFAAPVAFFMLAMSHGLTGIS